MTEMLGSHITGQSLLNYAIAAQASDTQVEVFDQLFQVFLVLGTLVGVVVIAYLLYNAYKYRTSEAQPEGRYDIDADAIEEDDDGKKVARPRLGEVPSQADTKSGTKLFLSFAISAILVLALVIFAYWNLLYVEDTAHDEDALEVQVVAESFFFEYTYPGADEDYAGSPHDDLVVPQDRVIRLNVTSCHPGECDGDVMHNWGSPDLRAKTDAIPGAYTETWIQADETGEYAAICYELCGGGHTDMRETEGIQVVSDEEFEDWCTENECMPEDELTDWLERTGGDS